MPLPMLRQLTLASLVAFGLAACGGSDSNPRQIPNSSSAGQSSSASVDEKPQQFSFEAQSDVERGATVTSNTITVSDINTDTSVSVSGGAYAVNGGRYTEAQGSVEDGDKVTVQLTAPESFSAEASATLTIGGVSDTFTVTTEEEDATPESFSFAPQAETEVGAENVASNSVTVSGINTQLPVRVVGGEYQINDQAFTSADGEVAAGDQLILRGNAPETPESTHEVVVHVGEMAETFAITTVADEEPPTVEVIFPTPTTATEGDAIAIRGVASDEISSVKSVTLSATQGDGSTVTGLVAKTDNDFEQWTAEVSLSSGENIISITAEDEHGNMTEEAVTLSVTRQLFTDAFPANQPFTPLDDSHDLVLDENRESVYVANRAGRNVVEIDLNTAKSSVLVNDLGAFRSLALDKDNDQLIMAVSFTSGDTDYRDGVFGYSFESGSVEMITTDLYPEEGATSISNISAITINLSDGDEAFLVESSSPNVVSKLDLRTGYRSYVSSNEELGGRLRLSASLLVDIPGNRIWAPEPAGIYHIDLKTGERTPFMIEGAPEGTPRLWIFEMTTDDIGDRIFVSDDFSREIWSIDVNDKSRTVISGEAVRGNINPLNTMLGLDVTEDGQLMFGVGFDSTAVWVIDVQTGERVILAKPEGDLPN
ncbi:hypothetical protein [Marinimicrobium locisalis]|uniref:hypothetical protein n=1 Tax=Marinimicrobium locisalis TaxID=546022 RepID=UPI0032218E4C